MSVTERYEDEASPDRCRGKVFYKQKCQVQHAKYRCPKCDKPLCGSHLRRIDEHKCKRKK